MSGDWIIRACACVDRRTRICVTFCGHALCMRIKECNVKRNGHDECKFDLLRVSCEHEGELPQVKAGADASGYVVAVCNLLFSYKPLGLSDARRKYLSPNAEITEVTTSEPGLMLSTSFGTLCYWAFEGKHDNNIRSSLIVTSRGGAWRHATASAVAVGAVGAGRDTSSAPTVPRAQDRAARR
ncbi:hypothetical protein EVAR_42836_1 [Eumeta japonica]|uniref:Uncharacterized protein n=1 Tax=Eumeta variegata TaxID=151549 RepID=A0A4C1WJ70_EUMVA|nr:hypothetical protein EVAR_42836_1 [Eumeta japonica]